LFLFPLRGILRPPAYALTAVLPFMAPGWLGIGAIAAGLLRARRHATFDSLRRVFMPHEDNQREPTRGIRLSNAAIRPLRLHQYYPQTGSA
jgi:hypothetical protein